MRLNWVLFDLNGTLLDPATMARPLGGDDAARSLVHAGLEDAVSQSMVDTMTGEFRPFTDYLGAALSRRLRLERGDDELCEAALELASQLDPFPHSAPAVARLRKAGLEVGVLTNSATGSARDALAHAGLDESMSAVIGCDEVKAYKPDPRVYRHAIGRLGVSADSICLVAAHSWDCVGAQRAGLRTAWSAHQDGLLPDTADGIDVTGEDLAAVAEQIVAA